MPDNPALLQLRRIVIQVTTGFKLSSGYRA